MTEVIILSKSPLKTKKWKAEFSDGKTIHFGAKGFSDFTLTGDETKKKAYIARHKVNENWTKSGLRTAGFLSRWILWNKPTILASIKDVEDGFNIKIKYK
jgi:hypothetical protein